MVDSCLDSLPWEHLKVFRSIGAKTKDFSLYQLAKKYQDQQEKKKVWDEVRYIANDFKGNEDNFNQVLSGF